MALKTDPHGILVLFAFWFTSTPLPVPVLVFSSFYLFGLVVSSLWFLCRKLSQKTHFFALLDYDAEVSIL